MRSTFTLLIVALFVTTPQAWAQPAKEKEFKAPPTSFECRWADGKITIDGKADEDAWKDAQVIDNFYLPWLGKKARAAKTTTKAKLLWDREYLYFFADMEDADLYADEKENDGILWENDVFELFFKPSDDKPGYYEFQVNAAGAVLDMFLPRRGAGGYKRFIKDSEFHIDAKVVLRGTLNKWTDKDEGWSVEGRIPWKDFLKTGGRPEPGEKWKFTLCRYDYSVDFEGPELSVCSPMSTNAFPNFHFFEDYATLKFVGPPKQSRKPYGIEKRIPVTTSTVIGSPEPPPPYFVKKLYPNQSINFPIVVRHQPGSDQLIYVAEDGPYANTVIRRMRDAADVSTSEELLRSNGVVYDILFHPKFAENGYFYLGWNGPSANGAKHTKVTRYTMSTKAPYAVDKKSEKLIIEWPSDGHNGGAICFGNDGMMYITSGDGTSDSDTNVMGQRIDTLLAKVLRIDVDHPDEGKTYSVPKDNPFIGMKDARPETWAFGFRNPWRIHCDAKTGHIWVGNNGQDLWEQIYFVKPGDNFGWSVFEGSQPFYETRKLGPAPHTKPAFEHHHSEARSMTGGLVYYGKRFPELVGAYIYGDYSTGRIWAGKHDGNKVLWHKEIAQTRLQITGFGTDSKGEILICDHAGNNKGGFYTLEPTPKETAPSKFPKKLSDSGLFESVKGHVMKPGVIPYSVNAPFWSDGAHKERYLMMPGSDTQIDFTRSRGWILPNQTVLIKSFALETEQGNPRSRKWIETRFLTRQDNEWYGYSYLWNDEQTDATLVASNGLDKDYDIRTKTGNKVQKWHYPSRSECMVCHSRAANWVLGLTELQMNKDHDYGKCTDNQLRTLEHLGMLKVNYFEDTKSLIRDELEAAGLAESKIQQAIEKHTATRDQRPPVGGSSLLSFAPEKYKKLVNPYDRSADINLRAKSFLHANCSSCHVEAGGGNAQMELEFGTKLEKMRILDVKPIHNTFNLPAAKLVAPGHPEASVLVHRMSHRDQGHMPPLSTFIVDQEAVEMMREWIQKVPMPAKKD
jgi:uncharacterized repeat protein (TIGR03806 family)